MEGKYDIYMGEDRVGEAEVMQQGLYLQISCRCRLSGAIICRVLVFSGDKQENLGTLIPEGEYFCLRTKIPVKRLSQSALRFRAMPRRGTEPAKFVPIYPEEPFAYIHRLKEAYLEIQNGQIGVRIP